MTEREALLRAVCENPDDDTPRLVFADWLQENGEPERAEFIRLQVQFAALHRETEARVTATALPFTQPGQPARGLEERRKEVRSKERAIWAKHKERFRAELPELDGVVWFEEFHRGFVEITTISSDAQLVRLADTIFDQVPIRHLTISRFTAVAGFAHLAHLRRLRTLKLINRGADQAVVRRFMLCDQLPESILVLLQFMPQMSTRLKDELRRTFGERISIQ